MIQINVKTNTARKAFTREITDTPISVLNEMGLSTTGTQINLNGTILSAADQNAPFEKLGVQDGQSYTLNVIVKADGGAN